MQCLSVVTLAVILCSSGVVSGPGAVKADTQSFAWSDLLPWNWSLFAWPSPKNNTSPVANATISTSNVSPIILIPKLKTSRLNASSGLVPVGELDVPALHADAKRDLIYEYDGYV